MRIRIALRSAKNNRTKSSALALAKDGIRVNTVNPGYITTGMVNEDTMGKEGFNLLIDGGYTAQ